MKEYLFKVTIKYNTVFPNDDWVIFIKSTELDIIQNIIKISDEKGLPISSYEKIEKICAFDDIYYDGMTFNEFEYYSK